MPGRRMSHPKNIVLDRAEIDRNIREGQGPHEDGSYSPWIYTPGVTGSEGAKYNWLGIITGRTHHVLSGWEYSIGNIFDFSLRVKNIREQYPLLPIDETLEIAKDLGVVHSYRRPKGRAAKYIVMTTDFLLDVETAEGTRYVARAVKQHDQLVENDWILEKLEIERQYWLRRNVDWGIITDLDFDHTMAENIIKLLAPHKTLEWRLDYSSEELNALVVNFVEMAISWQGTISQLLHIFEERHHMTDGTSPSLFWYILANRYLITDLTHPLNLSKSLNLLRPIP